ncbi:MAG: PLP-dependent aminotransferase family protein [Oscillospiraceae bacterium]
MLTYDLNRRGKTPIYDYLYRCIKQDIISGEIQAHEQLPSKRSLARHLNIGVITVANAYAQLLMEGYIYSLERQGYYAQNVENHQTKKLPEFTIEETDLHDHEFFVDFKANRTSLQHFPASIWNKYMREALSLQDPILLKTVPYNGLYALRQTIANYLLRNRGMQVQPSQIIIGAGTEYLYSRLLQLFGRDSIFAIEDPGYKKFAIIAASYGNDFKYIPIDGFGLMIDKLDESGADIVHVSPANHFPTGTVMPIKRRLELFEWAGQARERFIIEDDYDSEFRYTGKIILPLYTEDTQEKVIYMNTFSKSLVPSLRISFMVLPPKLLERYVDTMSFYSCTVSSFEQYTLARFISEGHFERHLNQMKNYYKEKRALILEAIKNSPLAKISKIIERNAGTHFLLNVRTELSDEQIFEAGLKRDMYLSFFSDYSYSKSSPEGYSTLVMNYAGIAKDKIADAVQRLSKIFLS